MSEFMSELPYLLLFWATLAAMFAIGWACGAERWRRKVQAAVSYLAVGAGEELPSEPNASMPPVAVFGDGEGVRRIALRQPAEGYGVAWPELWPPEGLAASVSALVNASYLDGMAHAAKELETLLPKRRRR